jgi:uracil-DNA glycosylase family 4
VSLLHPVDVLRAAGPARARLARLLDRPREDTLQRIYRAVAACRRCELAEGRRNPVPGEGAPLATVLIIGEGPGQVEDATGRPFVGPAGKLLDRLLAEVGVDRASCYVTNAVRCRPPQNRTPYAKEIKACLPWTTMLIREVDPDLILCLGTPALQVFRPGAKATDVHGEPFFWQGRLVFPTYHPAAGLRDEARLEDLRKDLAAFGRIVAKVRGLLALPSDAAARVLAIGPALAENTPVRIRAGGRRYAVIPDEVDVGLDTTAIADLVLTSEMLVRFSDTVAEVLADAIEADVSAHAEPC